MKLSRGCAELQLLVDRHAVFIRLISTPARAYLDSGANGICPEFYSSCTMGELAEWLPFFSSELPRVPDRVWHGDVHELRYRAYLYAVGLVNWLQLGNQPAELGPIIFAEAWDGLHRVLTVRDAFA